jgi:hemerythrin-like domain-containing protein
LRNESLKHFTEHRGLLVGKIAEALSYTKSTHLYTAGPDNQEFDDTFRELMQNVEHHVEEEETEMFPLAEQELSADLAEIKAEMQELKKEMMAS